MQFSKTLNTRTILKINKYPRILFFPGCFPEEGYVILKYSMKVQMALLTGAKMSYLPAHLRSFKDLVFYLLCF